MAVLHIALRELRSALTTPVAWLVLCAWLLLTGVVWFVLVTNYVAESQNLVFNPYGASMLKVGDWLLMPFYQTSMVILMFLAPAIAMRLFSLEYSQRTFELLVTSPVRSWEIVLGKWLGAMGLCALMLLGTVHVPVWLYIYATPDWGYFVGGYLGLWMCMSVLVGMGMLASSWTESQLMALVMGFSGSLLIHLLSWRADDPDSWMYQLSFAAHVQDVMIGSLRMSDLAYFAGFTLLMLFATNQRLESFRWR